MAEAHRPVGRPRKTVADKLVSLSTSVTPAVYDDCCRIAHERGISIAEVVREAVGEASRHAS